MTEGVNDEAARPKSGQQRGGGRLHGRVQHADQRLCAEAGCASPGEFRAPVSPGGARVVAADGEPASRWRWLCLDHVRAFNAAYNFFGDMTPDEISAASSPGWGWERATRPFATNAATRLGDPEVDDPHGILRARYGGGFVERTAAKARGFAPEERRALERLGLGESASFRDVRRRYVELVRRYHPDHNGGDRAKERKLQSVIDAYTQLKASAVFARTPQEVS